MSDSAPPAHRSVITLALDVAVEEAGPAHGMPVMLLHGWPDDARSWDRMLPTLHTAGLRTIVPFLCGFGLTRFRDADAMRSGQASALGAMCCSSLMRSASTASP